MQTIFLHFIHFKGAFICAKGLFLFLSHEKGARLCMLCRLALLSTPFIRLVLQTQISKMRETPDDHSCNCFCLDAVL